MKAIILCAGFGTRLGGITREIPKPMLPINGHPLLEYIIVNCIKYGFNEIAVNLHFKPSIIKNHFGDGTRYGASITYFYEDTLLGTAGSIKNMLSFVDNENHFLVHYGDIITDQNLMELEHAHKQKPKILGTLLIHSRQKSNSIIIIDSNTGQIHEFVERPSDEERLKYNSSWVNSGIAILDREIVNYIPNGVSDLPKDVYRKIALTGKLYSLPLNNSYRCAIDSPERYKEAQEAIQQNRCRLSLNS